MKAVELKLFQTQPFLRRGLLLRINDVNFDCCWYVYVCQNVRKELVAATYFEYYGAERVIVRQDHHSTFLGFLLRGELEVTVTKLDPVFGNWVTESTGHLLPGAMFGDVSLLHNIPRTATVTSTSQCPLSLI